MPNTLDEHHGYLSDHVKIQKYRAAIELAVHREHRVLDLGCGSGLLGLMALRAGAQNVIFVDDGAVIDVARRTVTEAGFADRAEFIQANSFELSLPEKVDVVISDHAGYFGFDYGVLALLADARKRFLLPDGRIVPAQLDLMLAPVESESCRNLVARWHDGSVPGEFVWLGDAAANTRHAVQLAPGEPLAQAATIATLELGKEAPSYLSWTAEFIFERDGILDGVAGWFDCTLIDDIRMTNSPVALEPLARPQAFLPLDSPVTVDEGEHIRVTVMLRHVDNVIGWAIELPESGRRFTHSTFNGLLLDREALARAHPDRIARLNDRGRACQIVLSYCDGQRTIGEVQALVERDHPALFPSKQATLSFITRVLAWDTGE
jgi:protein arginine N-methyltransferase 1